MILTILRAGNVAFKIQTGENYHQSYLRRNKLCDIICDSGNVVKKTNHFY